MPPFRALLAAAAALPLALPGAACGAPDAAAHGSVVLDSAGILVVENPPLDSPLPSWRLSAEPVVSIGALEAGTAYELYRPLHALRLDDGRIVVANQGTNELRFYGPAGRHLRTVAREGGGPGEFEGLWGLVRLPGDSLGAWDWTARRFTIFDHQGRLGRLVTPVGDLGFVPRLLGAFPDGSLAIARGLNPGAVAQQGGAVRDDSLVLLRLDPARGERIDSLGPYPADQLYLHLGDGRFWMLQIPFGRRQRVEVAAGQVHVGNDRSGEIRVYDPEGRLERVTRFAHDPVPVPADLLARQRERELETVVPERREEVRRRMEQVPGAETLPAFTDLFVDRLGRDWLEHFESDPESPRAWMILDTDGRPLARLVLPARARPLDAGTDYVLVYVQEDLDIEYVRLFDLIKEPET